MEFIESRTNHSVANPWKCCFVLLGERTLELRENPAARDDGLGREVAHGPKKPRVDHDIGVLCNIMDVILFVTTFLRT